ncbi:MAG: hypothetical protein SNG10_02655, partial [Rikenellaceae bacterium]
YENGKGQQYYVDFILNRSVPRQKALREVCDIYDQNTGMWNESPGYSTATTKDLMEILLLIDGIENKDILQDFSIVEKAALASFEYLLPSKQMVAFGDNGYSSMDYSMYESLLALYRKYNKKDREEALVAALNQHIEAGIYNREKGSSLYKLFNYVGEINPEVVSDRSYFSTLFYAPNINLTIQRSGMDRVDGLMLTNAGTGFNHNHNNGINMELYGKGYPLGVDKARGSSYWVPNHNEYYKATISHNTVLIDGVSSNSSKEQKPGEVSPVHKMLSSFPAANMKDSNDPYVLSYVDNQFIEQGTNSMQRRMNSIIRTSPTSGYYVDIFRSRKQEGGDVKHEYLYHNAGQLLTLFDEDDKKITLKASNDLTSSKGQVKGYDYITDKFEVNYTNNFRGTFELNMGAEKGCVNMDVWMKGYDNRKIFSVMTPRALKGLGGDMGKEIESAPIPALIVRQNGEAWRRPFVAIYEPYTTSEGKTIERVDYIESADDDFVGIEVCSNGGVREYILNTTQADKRLSLKDVGAEFQAVYGVVSTREDKLSYLFMGSGQLLSYGGYSISSQYGAAAVTALVEWTDEGIKVKSDGVVELSIPKGELSTTLSYTDNAGKPQTIQGVTEGSSIVYTLPLLDGVLLKVQ